MSKNKNCLEGVRCPNCGQEDRFHIAAIILVEVKDNGTEDLQTDYEWNSKSYTRCPECEKEGVLMDFFITEQEKLLLSSNEGAGI